MLHEVVIDGIRYVPQAIIQPQDDETLRRAGVSPLLRQLAQGVTGLVIEMLSPELSKVMAANIGAAFERTSSTD
ncbi:hypothetical protein ACEUCV_15475 [Aeromonas veronii]